MLNKPTGAERVASIDASKVVIIIVDEIGPDLQDDDGQECAEEGLPVK